MIPSINEGILWELDLILKEGFLGKVIFVMPPSKGLVFATSCEVKSLWEKTRAAFLERGLTIPEYRHSGAFFQCFNGRIYIQKMPTSRNPRKWTSALQNLIDQP